MAGRSDRLHRLDRRARAVGARQQLLVAEAAAAGEQQAVEDGVALFGVDADDVEAHRHCDPAGIEPDEMRRQQHHRPAGCLQRPHPAVAGDLDDPVQAFARGPPEQAALEHAAAEYREMPARERLARGGIELGKAECQIDAHDVPPLLREAEEQGAQPAAERRQQRERQEVQQPEKGDGGAGKHRQARRRWLEMNGVEVSPPRGWMVKPQRPRARLRIAPGHGATDNRLFIACRSS